MSELDQLKSQVSELAERLAVLERAPQLALHVKNARIVSTTRATLDMIARLASLDPDARSTAIRTSTSLAVKAAAELATHEQRVSIARDLDTVARKMFLGIVDRGEQALVIVDLIDANDLPEVVKLTNVFHGGIDWSRQDSKGRFAAGRTLREGDHATQLRSEFEAELASIPALAEHIQTRRLVVEPLDESGARKWLAAAIREERRWKLDSDLEIVELDLTADFQSTDDQIAATRRSAARVTHAARTGRSQALAREIDSKGPR